MGVHQQQPNMLQIPMQLRAIKHVLLMVRLPFRKLHDMASTPRQGSAEAAGVDLASGINLVVPRRGKALVSTGLAVSIPKGHYGRIAPRSGFSWRNHVDVGAGVIDSDYRGEVKVLLFNHKQEDLHIKKGERVAQLILEKYSPAQVVIVDSLDETTRGGNGFGSTGV